MKSPELYTTDSHSTFLNANAQARNVLILSPSLHIQYVTKPRELRSPKASVSCLLLPLSCPSPSCEALAGSHLNYCKEPP